MVEPVTINGAVLLRIPEAQKALGGMPRSTLYRELAAGRLPAVHRGRSVFIPAAAIVKYVETLTEGS